APMGRTKYIHERTVASKKAGISFSFNSALRSKPTAIPPRRMNQVCDHSERVAVLHTCVPKAKPTAIIELASIESRRSVVRNTMPTRSAISNADKVFSIVTSPTLSYLPSDLAAWIESAFRIATNGRDRMELPFGKQYTMLLL